jgi:hypothetical protein
MHTHTYTHIHIHTYTYTPEQHSKPNINLRHGTQALASVDFRVLQRMFVLGEHGSVVSLGLFIGRANLFQLFARFLFTEQ